MKLVGATVYRAAQRGATKEELDILAKAMYLINKYELDFDEMLRYKCPPYMKPQCREYDDELEALTTAIKLRRVLRTYGYLTVDDYYTLCEIDSDTSNLDLFYGWTGEDVDGITVTSKKFGQVYKYQVITPIAMHLPWRVEI